MKILRYFRVALESIQVNKLRSILTMLGIIIGVAAVLITVGIAQGASASITANIASQGTNLITISPGSTSVGGVFGGGGSASTLTMGDAAAMAEATFHPSVALVAPTYQSNAQLISSTTNDNNTVVGATADFASVRNLEIEAGRWLAEEDLTDSSSVMVIGSEVAETLFPIDYAMGVENVLGHTVRINGEPFTVIGVLAESGGMGFGSTDSQVFVPINVAQGRLFGADRYRGDYTVSSISVLAASEAQVDAAMAEVEQTLRLRHALAASESNDFSVQSQTSLLETLSSITGTLTLLLGGIGAVSLIVGGIGIMNIMLVTVTERTREIGLRKAVGAHDRDILLQFLIEALVLTTLGGLIGIGFSYAVAWIVGWAAAGAFTLLISTSAILMALGVSVASGLIFGLYPAQRATRLDPIDALRYE